MILSSAEWQLLNRFDDLRWIRRTEIDPHKAHASELKSLRRRGLITSHKPHDYPKEYALTDAGLFTVNNLSPSR